MGRQRLSLQVNKCSKALGNQASKRGDRGRDVPMHQGDDLDLEGQIRGDAFVANHDNVVAGHWRAGCCQVPKRRLLALTLD